MYLFVISGLVYRSYKSPQSASPKRIRIVSISFYHLRFSWLQILFSSQKMYIKVSTRNFTLQAALNVAVSAWGWLLSLLECCLEGPFNSTWIHKFSKQFNNLYIPLRITKNLDTFNQFSSSKLKEIPRPKKWHSRVGCKNVAPLIAGAQ